MLVALARGQVEVELVETGSEFSLGTRENAVTSIVQIEGVAVFIGGSSFIIASMKTATRFFVS